MTEKMGNGDRISSLDKRLTVETSPQSVLRVVQILHCAADNPDGCSLAFLSKQVDAPKSSVLRLLRGLVKGGYLVYTKRSYQLGMEAFYLASKIGGSKKLSELYHLVLADLSDKTGETSAICVLTTDRTEVMGVEVMEGRHAIRANVRRGVRAPLYSTATGRVFLAFMPSDESKAYLRNTKLVRATRATEIRRHRLREILDEVRTNRVAVVRQESDEGLTGIASPIFDNKGEVEAAVFLAGPVRRVNPNLKEWSALVRATSDELSLLHGYRGGDKTDTETGSKVPAKDHP